MRLFVIALICWLSAGASLSHAAPAPLFQEPVVITSAGQSSDLLLARQFFNKAGVGARASARFTADSLGGVKTLVLVVGGSSKGLGQAKDAAGAELTRIAALLKRARTSHVPVLCLHVGREARRGPLSDPFITPVVPQSQQVLVLAGGNKDGLFGRLAGPAKVPVAEAADYRDLVARISACFGRKPVK